MRNEHLEPLRVLLYTATPRAHAGGVQRVVADLLAALRRENCEALAAYADAGPNPGRAIALPLRLRDPRGFSDFAGLARRFRPHVVNVHFVTGQTAYVLLGARLFGYRTVLSAHGSDVHEPRPSLRPLLPHLLSRADALTAVSDTLATAVQRLAPSAGSRLRVIPNGIDLDFWAAPRRNPREPRIVAVARLEPVKGLDVLLRAFALLRERRPDARLDIIGDGAEREALQALARNLGLDACVAFRGALPRDAVRERLSAAACFALTSRSEGMPLALLEAMAVGVPAVASAVGAVPELLAGGAGRLVPPDDPLALADALAATLAAPQPDMAQRARNRVQPFAAAATAAAYAQLYRDLAFAGRRAR